MGEVTKKVRSIDIIKKRSYPENKKSSESLFFEPRKTSNKPILLSRGRRSSNFFTNDSGLYAISSSEKSNNDKKLAWRNVKRWDSVSARIVSDYRSQVIKIEKDFLYERFKKSHELLKDDIESVSESLVRNFSVAKIWNLSIVASMLFGMFSMTMIYRYLGQGASAGDVTRAMTEDQMAIEDSAITADNKLEEEGNSYTRRFLEESFSEDKTDLEEEIREMVKGYPIEEMVPYIAEKDRIVAAFLIGIAKKESNWGKRIPVLNGQDCYNYWGYRGIRKLMGTGGHTCFNSRKDAVDTVAKRIQWLVENEELDTPKKMVIWKCGSDCSSTGGWAAANKWIDDVNMYFKKLSDEY